jgi:hypothetical protein
MQATLSRSQQGQSRTPAPLHFMPCHRHFGPVPNVGMGYSVWAVAAARTAASRTSAGAVDDVRDDIGGWRLQRTTMGLAGLGGAPGERNDDRRPGCGNGGGKEGAQSSTCARVLGRIEYSCGEG